MALKDTASKFMDLKSIVSAVVGIVMTLGASFTYIDSQIDEWSSNLTDRMYSQLSVKLREDIKMYEYFSGLSYEITKYGLMKQLEKIANDPADIKDMDLLFYASVCDKDLYFNLEYMPKSEYSRGLRIACQKILEINDERYGKR